MPVEGVEYRMADTGETPICPARWEPANGGTVKRPRTRTALFLLMAGTLLSGTPAPASGQWDSPAGPVPVEKLQARREALLTLLAGEPAVSGVQGRRALEVTGLEPPGTRQRRPLSSPP